MLSQNDLARENYLQNAKKLYVCGPTVYSDSHIGHARCYMIVDIFYRIMKHIARENVYLVMNITDVNNKIIKRAQDTNTTWQEIAKTYEKSFFDAMTKLNIQKPKVVIRVSEVIPEIIAYIQKIMDNGFAYPTKDGSVYFDSVAYENAGYVFGNNDVDIEEYKGKVDVKVLLSKRNRRDFSLWKGREKSEVGFSADFIYKNEKTTLYGIPGWHIECSCMIDQTIGPVLDIHMGGIDLKYPHHHNEQLQANAFHHPCFTPEKCKKWCQEFMHVGHVRVDGKKMAKSSGNYITITDALREINANQLRWMFMTHKWHEPLEYSDETILHAKNFDTMINNFLNRVANYPFNNVDIKYNNKEFLLEENFNNISRDILFSLTGYHLEIVCNNFAELINKTNAYLNQAGPNEHLVNEIYLWIRQMLTLLGFNYDTNTSATEADIMSVVIDTRTSLRNLAREKTITPETKKKLFEILDSERNVKLKEIGIVLQDTRDSSAWYIDK